MEYQRTVADVVIFEGEGVFSGKKIRVEIHPLRENEGIVFERADLSDKSRIPLVIENIVGLEGAVLLTNGKESISLVEHLLSAFHGLGIDNALVKVFGEEIPLLDGSAFPIVRALQEVGYLLLPAPRKKFVLKRPFQLVNGVGKISFKPSHKLSINARIYFEHPSIGEQTFKFTLTPQDFIREVSFARTFGFKDLLEERKKKGLLKGGSLSNAIVIDKEKVLNAEGLRAQDEFVRHKVLDIVGDLFTLGHPLLAEVSAELTGHKLHIEALKALSQAGLLEEVSTRALTFLWIPKKKRRSF